MRRRRRGARRRRARTGPLGDQRDPRRPADQQDAQVRPRGADTDATAAASVTPADVAVAAGHALTTDEQSTMRRRIDAAVRVLESLLHRTLETRVSPSAARALPCRAARAGASAPVVDGQ